MKRWKLLTSILSTGMIFPCLTHAGFDLSFDSVKFSGDRWTDMNYSGTSSANTYVGIYTDNTNGVKVRMTLVDIIGTVGSKPEGSYEHALAGDNATLGVTYDFNTTNGDERTDDDGAFETGPDNPGGYFSRYKVEFLNTDMSAREKGDYRLSIFDIDHTANERIELVKIEDSYITSEARWRADGAIVNANYTGTTIYTDPDLDGSPAPQDVSYVEKRENETLNEVEFRTYAGLANFDTNEAFDTASGMGGISVVLSEVQSFEMIVGAESTGTDARTRARFVVDFGDPPDNETVVVPEAKFSGLLMGIAALFVAFRRRARP